MTVSDSSASATRGPTAQAPAQPKGSATVGPLSRLVLACKLAANLAYDGRRLWKHSYLTGIKGPESLRSRMHMTGHFLEYGMSMRDIRPGFGKDRVALLLADLNRFATGHGWDSTCEISLATLRAYRDLNAGLGEDMTALDAELSRMETLRNWQAESLGGGAETVSAEEIRAAASIDFLEFAEARHSIRQFAPGPVDQDKIERAVRAAQMTPSSCNRQTCRTWIWTEPEMVQRVLAMQSGNRSFGHEVAGVAIVASDLTHWYEVEERYQGWVDAGMFAMTLALGLHAEGLGAVMLNWGEEYQQDKALRELTGIPDSMLVSVMIGFGNLPDDLKVPVSQREPLSTCLTMNQPLRQA